MATGGSLGTVEARPLLGRAGVQGLPGALAGFLQREAALVRKPSERVAATSKTNAYMLAAMRHFLVV
jgi:hypothetical protein